MSILEAVRAYSFEPRVPPREVQLWAAGENPTDYGAHLWTERSAREVGGAYQGRGNLVQLDIEHNCSAPEREKAPDAIPPTAGYARLEIRAGVPFLVFEDEEGRSTWSAVGAEQIATGQRLYLSAEYQVDRSTKEIVGVARVSLVAKPGTHFARLLASGAELSDTKPGTETVRANAGGPMELAVILAALRAALAAEDPAVCKESVAALLAELSKGAGGEKPAGDAPPGEAKAAAPPGAPPAPPAPGGEEEKKDEPVAAAAKPAPAASTTVVVHAAAPTSPAIDAAMRRVDDLERDLLLREKGHRLEESIRAWASSQPLSIVKGLVSAAPEKEKTAVDVRATATRGAGHGKGGGALPPEQKAEMDARMGLGRSGPAVRRDGDSIVLGVMTSAEARDHIRARAAEKGGAR